MGYIYNSMLFIEPKNIAFMQHKTINFYILHDGTWRSNIPEGDPTDVLNYFTVYVKTIF